MNSDATPGEFAGHRFAFLSYDDFNLYRFRLPVMKRLVAAGAKVYAIAPSRHGTDLFRSHGITFVPFDMAGTGLDPWYDLRTAARLERLIGTLRPHVLQTFMLKPNIVGGWLARRARDVQVVSTVTGLGRLYEDGAGWKDRTLRWGVERLLGRAFDNVSAVVFQNADDRSELVGRGLCRPEVARLIVSSGVDLDEFSPQAVDPERVAALRERWGIVPGEPVVTMVARLLPSKGVREFAAAARALEGRARCVLIGSLQANGVSVPRDEVLSWQHPRGLIAPGIQDNIPEWLALSDVYALPSYYREGIPRSSLEAMAMHLPIVTTRMPGCRETVVEGDNGFLVPPRDVAALVAALSRLVDDPVLRERMGERSRALVARRFASDAVAGQHLVLYRELLGRAPAA